MALRRYTLPSHGLPGLNRRTVSYAGVPREPHPDAPASWTLVDRTEARTGIELSRQRSSTMGAPRLRPSAWRPDRTGIFSRDLAKADLGESQEGQTQGPEGSREELEPSMPSLSIEVHLLEPLWHGAVDWPPSPFRLFQALVAGAYGGRWARRPNAGERRAEAFQWLERQNPPTIAFRHVTVCDELLRSYRTMISTRSAATREEFSISVSRKYSLLGHRKRRLSFLYAWEFDEGGEHASRMCGLAERLYSFRSRIGRRMGASYSSR